MKKTIQIKCKGADLLPYESLMQFQGDLKTLSKSNLEKLKQQIVKNGFVAPFYIWVNDKKNQILDGSQRNRALKSLIADGYEIPLLPVVYIQADNEADAKEKLLAISSQYGEWNKLELETWLDGIDDEIKDTLRFVDKEITIAMNRETIDDDEVREVEYTGIIKEGDLIKCGRHRILCGDSTKIEDVERLMDGNKADMVFADPPYGMKKEKEGVINDNLNLKQLLKFNNQWILLSMNNIKDNGSIYIWGIDEPLMDIYNNILKDMIAENKITFRNIITWDKGSGQGQLAEEFRMYPIADEKCLFFMCGVQGFNNNADHYFEGWEPIRNYLLKSRKAMGWDVPTMKRIVGHSDILRDHWTGKSQFTFPTRKVYESMQDAAEKQRNENKSCNDAFKKEYDALKKEYDALKKEYYSTRAYFNNTHDNMNNVWHFSRHYKDGSEGEHATIKPIPLCERAIITSSEEMQIVQDLFLGSGSTLIACEKTDRICYGMEIEPNYCEVILNRYIDWCNKNDIEPTVKINGQPYTP